jgi:hypothetical protein
MSYRAFFIVRKLTVLMAGLLYSRADGFCGYMLYPVIFQGGLTGFITADFILAV